MAACPPPATGKFNRRGRRNRLGAPPNLFQKGSKKGTGILEVPSPFRFFAVAGTGYFFRMYLKDLTSKSGLNSFSVRPTPLPSPVILSLVTPSLSPATP